MASAASKKLLRSKNTVTKRTEILPNERSSKILLQSIHSLCPSKKKKTIEKMKIEKPKTFNVYYRYKC